MKKTIFVPLLAVLTMTVVSCSVYFSPQRQLDFLNNKQNQGDDGNVIFTADSVLDYETIQSLSLRTCVKCHSGKRAPDLSDHGKLVANLGNVLKAIDQGRMPPSDYPALTSCQKDALRAWADLGAPEQASQLLISVASCKDIASGQNPLPPSTTLPPPPLSQMPLDYQTFASRILKPKCLSCHRADGDTDAADTLLFPYGEITAQRSLLGTSSANSKIFRVVRSEDPDVLMPPPDSDYSHLTAEEIDFVKKWLDAGHPEHEGDVVVTTTTTTSTTSTSTSSTTLMTSSSTTTLPEIVSTTTTTISSFR